MNDTYINAEEFHYNQLVTSSYLSTEFSLPYGLGLKTGLRYENTKTSGNWRTKPDDEFDNNELIERKISDNEYEFSARMEVDYLNENYKLHLPVSEEYETLGGLIVNSTEEIPTVKEEIRVGNFLFKILDVSNTRINLVSLKIDA